MANSRIPLGPAKFYHIYNHGNGKDNIFKSDANYLYFLQLYAKHINPIADTFAYCLMPNHFHVMARMKPGQELTETFKDKIAIKNPQGFQNLAGLNKQLSDLLSNQFSNFFNAYTKAFNIQQNRNGSLFLNNFKRKQVDSDSYFQQLIHYIHFNPVHHMFVKSMDEWKYSSYHSLLSVRSTLLKREEVMERFGDRDNFLTIHQNKMDEKFILEMEY